MNNENKPARKVIIDLEAYIYGIPVYYVNDGDRETMTIYGRNWFYEVCLRVALFFAVYVFFVEDFPIEVKYTQRNEPDENN